MDGPLGVAFEAQLLSAALAAANKNGGEQKPPLSQLPQLSADMRVNGVDGLEVRVERCNSVIGEQSQEVDVLVVSERGYVSRLIIPPQQPGERILGLYPQTASLDCRPSVGFFGGWTGVVQATFVSGRGRYTVCRNDYYDLRTGKAVEAAEMFDSLRHV